MAPNPTSNQVTVYNLKGEYQKLILYNNLGNNLLDLDLKESFEKELDLSNFANGYYHIELKGNTKSQYFRLIKN